MSKKKILIVEDDRYLSQLITYNLERAEYHCFTAADAETALKLLLDQNIDLVILDIELPGMDGFECCTQIKKNQKFHDLPIVMLTARNEEIDRIVGFELGADDYIAKPFSTRELVLRIKAVLKRRRRETGAQGDVLSFERLVLDIPRHKVRVEDREITLTHLEFKLLLTLLQRKGKVQSRERLLEDVWNIEADITTRTVDTHIRHLRQKLGKSGKWIKTVRCLGYCFHEGDESA